ncbi:MAG: Fic family protein [Euryarchaeota archaeon]|nr:Fic family protein [Euryarchaeota archaeon]
MPPDLDPSPYRVTPETLWRPETPPLPPRFALDAAIHSDLERIARADEQLRTVHLDALSAKRMLEETLSHNAYGTASIEGNPLTLEEVESLLARGPTPENLVVPDEREILNHAALMEDLDDLTPPRTPEDVRALHSRLFEGVLEDAGRFKDGQNFIGHGPTKRVVFVPTPPDRVEAELQTALDWVHGDDAHPLVKAFVFFHEFQGIHPFRDGNGRTGRLVNTILLHHAGYPGVRYAFLDYAFNADREGYYGTLAEVEREHYDFTPWVRYMARTLRRTMEEAVERYRLRDTLPPGLNDRQERLALWFARSAQEHPGRRVALNDVHAVFPAIPERTLRRDLGALVEAGVLLREGERKGTRYRLAPQAETDRGDGA